MNATPLHETRWLLPALILLVGLVYYFSNPQPNFYYDYTFRVAENFFHGAIGFREKPPSWLNEFVPFEEYWYSVFPLGSVLSMLPFAYFKFVGVITVMPAALIAALLAAGICSFLYLISLYYEQARLKKIVLILGILFGTWMWTNLTMGGAWQLALGFAMLGQLGAIYFTVFDRQPFWAGVFFALAFGNRTEVLLTAPVLMYLLVRDREPAGPGVDSPAASTKEISKAKKKKARAEDRPPARPLIRFDREALSLRLGRRHVDLAALAKFCVVPFVLGVLTLTYNYVRFHSPTDFGYARIPGVLDEPWYKYGIFSVWYIPGQAYEMLVKTWETRNAFPYLVPNGFSASILWSSPFLLFAFRTGARDKVLKRAAWAAIVVLTILLWMHGNSGGWQFGYRYAMVLLPWIFLLLLESSPRKMTLLEWLVYGFSFVVNAWATYLFHWTGYLKS